MSDDLKPVDIDGDDKADLLVKFNNGDVYISVRWIIGTLSAIAAAAAVYLGVL